MRYSVLNKTVLTGITKKKKKAMQTLQIGKCLNQMIKNSVFYRNGCQQLGNTLLLDAQIVLYSIPHF